MHLPIVKAWTHLPLLEYLYILYYVFWGVDSCNQTASSSAFFQPSKTCSVHVGNHLPMSLAFPDHFILDEFP